MRFLKYILLLIIVLSLLGCAPAIRKSISKSYPPIAYNAQVYVFDAYQTELEGGEKLGVIGVMDSGFTSNCSYDEVLNAAKIAAREEGGNAILIVDHLYPSIWNTCHQITVEVFRVENIDELMKKHDEE